jgi:hypothetical protein
MAEGDRAMNRTRKTNTEGTGRSVAAIIASLLAKAFELNRSQVGNAENTVFVGEGLDSDRVRRHIRQIGTTGKEAGQFFAENCAEESGRAVPALDGVVFCAAFL